MHKFIPQNIKYIFKLYINHLHFNIFLVTQPQILKEYQYPQKL